MKNFFRFIFFCLAVVTVLSACNKESVKTIHVATTGSTSADSMIFMANNTKISFNTCLITQSYVNNVPELLVLGYNVTNSKVSDNNFEVDLYANIDSIKTGQVFNVSSSFLQPGSMDLFFSPDTISNYSTSTAKPVGTVTITAITSKQITGTFSGNLYNQSDFSAESLSYTISNGTFVAKRD